MPPANYEIEDKIIDKHEYWNLPLVLRYGHVDGVAPYSGQVPIIYNSRLLKGSELNDEIEHLCGQIKSTMNIIKPLAPVRVDCRADNKGKFHIIDINLKPNITGNIRPGQSDKLSLMGMAAQGIGWTYKDLITNLISVRWSVRDGEINISKKQ